MRFGLSDRHQAARQARLEISLCLSCFRHAASVVDQLRSGGSLIRGELVFLIFGPLVVRSLHDLNDVGRRQSSTGRVDGGGVGRR